MRRSFGHFLGQNRCAPSVMKRIRACGALPTEHKVRPYEANVSPLQSGISARVGYTCATNPRYGSSGIPG